MSPTPPLYPYKRSHHHLRSTYTLPLMALATTPRSPLAWLRPSFTWRMVMTSTTPHVPSHTALSPQCINVWQSPTKGLPKPTTTSTSSLEQYTPTKPRSTTSETGRGTARCPLISSATGDEWTSKCPPTMARTLSPTGSKSWGMARSLPEQESTPMSQNTWSPSTSPQTTHNAPPPPYHHGLWSYSRPRGDPTTPWLKQPVASNTLLHTPRWSDTAATTSDRPNWKSTNGPLWLKSSE